MRGKWSSRHFAAVVTLAGRQVWIVRINIWANTLNTTARHLPNGVNVPGKRLCRYPRRQRL